MWDNESKKVIYIKSLNEKLLPKTLEERYIQVFGKDDFKSIEKVLSNLMTAVDIKILVPLLHKKNVILQLQVRCKLVKELIDTIKVT